MAEQFQNHCRNSGCAAFTVTLVPKPATVPCGIVVLPDIPYHLSLYVIAQESADDPVSSVLEFSFIIGSEGVDGKGTYCAVSQGYAGI